MRTIALFAAALVVAGATGCVRVHRDPATGNADVDVESPLKRGEDWSGSLAGRGTYTNVTGTVRASVEGDNTTTTIRVTGLPPRAYVPRADVVPGVLAPTDTRTICPYKGEASYWSVAGIADAAWSYETPLPEAVKAEGHVAFDGDGIEVSLGEPAAQLPTG